MDRGGPGLTPDGRWYFDGRRWREVEAAKAAPVGVAMAAAGQRVPPRERRQLAAWVRDRAGHLLAAAAGVGRRLGHGHRPALAGPPAGSVQRRLLRAVVFGAAAVLLLLGLRDVVTAFAPAGPPPSRPVTAAQVGPEDLAAAAFATRVAVAYLSYDAAHPEQRRQALAPYVGSASEDWNGQGTEQVSMALPSAVRDQGRGRATVTVAALVSGGRWLYLAVPVRDLGGVLALGGQPALVPAPAASAWPGAQAPAIDGPLSAELVPTVRNFFAAWAAGDETQLAYYSAPGAGLRPLGGVSLGGLQELDVLEGKGERRDAIARVSWQDPGSGAELTQPYRLHLLSVAHRWLVASVEAGA